jgi:hypothetical protein
MGGSISPRRAIAKSENLHRIGDGLTLEINRPIRKT